MNKEKFSSLVSLLFLPILFGCPKYFQKPFIFKNENKSQIEYLKDIEKYCSIEIGSKVKYQDIENILLLSCQEYLLTHPSKSFEEVSKYLDSKKFYADVNELKKKRMSENQLELFNLISYIAGDDRTLTINDIIKYKGGVLNRIKKIQNYKFFKKYDFVNNSKNYQYRRV